MGDGNYSFITSFLSSAFLNEALIQNLLVMMKVVVKNNGILITVRRLFVR